jgi:hypothetical protein
MPFLAASSLWIILLFAISLGAGGAGCDKGPALQCDQRVGCPAPQVCDIGTNQCVGMDDNVTCSSNENCAAPTPVCFLEASKCVQCIAEGVATDECPNRRICQQRSCIACEEDSDCDGNLCARNGGCPATSDVAIVTAAGTVNAACNSDKPCTLKAALDTSRANIRIAGAITLPEALLISRSVALYGSKSGPATTITRSTVGPVLEVSGTGTIELTDLVLFGGTGPDGDAVSVSGGAPILDLGNVKLVDNAGIGIDAGAATLRLSRSLVVNNAGGGISADGPVALENNIIARNGSASSAFGGLRLRSAASDSVVRFNTIADNLALSASAATVSCAALATRLSSNIFTGIVGNCTTAYSLFPAGTTVTGSGDRAGDPMFILTTLPANRDATEFYHLGPGSKAMAGGEVFAVNPLTGDYDGDSRLADLEIGADEIPN